MVPAPGVETDRLGGEASGHEACEKAGEHQRTAEARDGPGLEDAAGFRELAHGEEGTHFLSWG